MRHSAAAACLGPATTNSSSGGRRDMDGRGQRSRPMLEKGLGEAGPVGGFWMDTN